MRTGLQVFTVHQPHAPGAQWPYNGFHGKRIPDDLAPYIARGEVVWENYVHGIAPDPQIAKRLADVLPKRLSSVR